MNAIERNLDLIDRHMKGEAIDVDSILDLYTEDVIFEVPGRGLYLVGRSAIRKNYVEMWASLTEVELQPLERFATEDRVVDDTIVRFRLSGDGMKNAPAPLGSKIELRLIHHFSVKNNLISREAVFEAWRVLD